MSRLRGTATAAVRWVGAEIAPIVLLPLAAVLVWVSVWKVWLPAPGAGTPSRRSVTLAIVLLVLGVSSAVIAVFHDRLRRIQLSRTGLTVTLTAPERDGLGALVERLAAGGASSDRVAEAIRRYLDAVQSRRPAKPKALAPAGEGLSAEEAHALAERIAAETI
ncbi:MAG TPA: hypothetical protein VFB42_01665 [Gaiellaceae bacterium]|nr:hypothetical protein [Gaiellaceae bacterium]